MEEKQNTYFIFANFKKYFIILLCSVFTFLFKINTYDKLIKNKIKISK